MNAPLHILFISGEYPPLPGGVGDYTRCLAAALREKNVRVSVLTANKVPPGGADVYPFMPGWGFGHWPRLERFIDALQPDWVHWQYQTAAFGMSPGVNLWPLWQHRKRSRPRIAVTFHDLRVPYLFPKAGFLRQRANWLLARYADAVIVTNHEDETTLRRAVPAACVTRIPIGSNVEAYPRSDADTAAVRRRWGIPVDAHLLGYFGFLNASKGGEDLIDALALLRKTLNVHLFFIGGQTGASDPTDRRYLEQMRARVRRSDLSDRVHWSGFLDDRQLSAIFYALDLMVLPYRDGVSLRRGSLHAALRHGLPIVSTIPATLPPEIEPGVNMVLVPPADPPALRDAIAELLPAAERRRTLGQAAARLSEQFRWDEIARRTVAVYTHAW